MKFRYARHTTDLHRIEVFYTTVVGLKKLGGFENHDSYNGLFLGLPGLDWHLEFTQSNDKPESQFDEDDALVFYLESEDQLQKKKERILKNHIKFEQPKNPYWAMNGIMVSDPDGYKIIFALKG